MEIKTDKILRHVLYLARRFDSHRIRQVVIMLLIELGIPTQCEGFEYLVQAIVIYIKDPLQMITTEVYPAIVGLRNGLIETDRIDQAIRRAINAGWKRHDDVWSMYFPCGRGGKLVRPSNTVFISRIARVLELWIGCCELNTLTCSGTEVVRNEQR